MNDSDRREPVAGVLSIDEFRAKISPQEHEQLERSTDTYEFADYLTLQAVGRIYSIFNGGPPADGIGVFEVTTGVSEGKVYIAQADETREFFAVEKSQNQLESITLDLGTHEDDEIERLSPLLERFYTCTLIGELLIRRDYPIEFSKEVPPPKAGARVIAIERHDSVARISEEWKEMTRWRVAAGVALHAATFRAPKLRAELTHYLAEVLDSRYSYELAVQMVEATFGREVPQEDENTIRFLIGICNPFVSQFDVKKLLKKPQRSNDAAIKRLEH
jgi:hypothetical protein